MKTNDIAKPITCFIIFVLIIISAIETRSQQLIIFTDGTKSNVFITYQSRDTVKYYLGSRPEIVYVETSNHIRQIIPLNPSSEIPDSMSYSQCRKKYARYLSQTIVGPILIACGGVLTGLGIAGLVSVADDKMYIISDGATFASAIFTVGGVVCLLSGVAITASGASNIKKYKEKLRGFSFDLKCTPQVKGISVAYRF